MKNLHRNCFLLVFIAGILFGLSSRAISQSTVIDVLVVYDTFSRDKLNNQVNIEMEQWVADINSFYQTSGVNISLNLVGTRMVNVNSALHPHTILFNMQSSTHINSLRNQYGADLVLRLANLLDPIIYNTAPITGNKDSSAQFEPHQWGWILKIGNESTVNRSGRTVCSIIPVSNRYSVTGDCLQYQVKYNGICGLAFISSSEATGFSTVDPRCGSIAAAHELGHNMGLAHDRLTSPNSPSTFTYGRGYGVHGEFSTIMGYPSSYNTNTYVPAFSNPRLILDNTFPLGIPIGQANEADASTALNNVAWFISNHRTEGTGLPVTGPGSEACENVCGQYQSGTSNRAMCLSYTPACQ